MSSQNELKPLFLLQKISNIVLQARLLILQLISFLQGGREIEEVALIQLLDNTGFSHGEKYISMKGGKSVAYLQLAECL